MSSSNSSSFLGHLAGECQQLTGIIARLTGVIAALSLLLLTCSIILGISLRQFKIDNSWTYDLDLYCLVWLAFSGAVTTALHRRHVTAGIALENMFGRSRGLIIIRFLIILGFLIILTIAGLNQAAESWQMHEVTLDVVQWPVWIAEIAIPIGAAIWGITEIHKFLHDIRQSS
ncbi:MAG: hypothetical protein CENE_03625 [Candidatus Celerinatantimonas neptuna]|nr:MAG: hypothetical protein CENE_03625 [Candidatus Celerinatantimonas neptuna]